MSMTNLARAILWGGLLCGTLDAIAATVSFFFQGISPVRLWQGVASGLLGAKSFQYGWKSSSLGLLLHYCIALSAATVFCMLAQSLPQVLLHFALAGIVYGLLVFLVMNLIVVPLSARPKRPYTLVGVVSQLIIHVLFVGLPIAVTAHGFLVTN